MKQLWFVSIVLAVGILGITSFAQAQSQEMEDKIENAMSAAPLAIAKDATIMDWPTEAGGKLTELSKGTNGWTCVPDDPTNPANDPMCMDDTWLAWLEAAMAGTEPQITTPGIAYMFQGGAVADNNDPSILEPPAGQEWQVDPPHLMVVFPEKLDPAMFSSDVHSGGPWIMFGGTPYEHLMVPVKEDKIENAMSAAPLAIAKDATIMDWPTEAGGKLTELSKGTNGWTCVPDDPTNPANDPMCMDDTWLAWLEAAMAGTEPQITTPGIAYMFQGGAVADNNDPSILEPPAGQEWQVDPPHLMVVFPEKLDPAMFPSDVHSGGPWIMFGGTPYEHLMVPVKEEASQMDAKMENAMSAAPLAIAKDATIMDWPTEAGGKLTELRKGTNTWTCVPDDPTNPANDPMCMDDTWLAWLEAAMAGTEPQITTPGIAYMFQGGAVADNNDPSILEPPAGQEWQVDPPHLMVVFPEKLDPAMFPSDVHSGGPWIMFGGTPYEHLMVPVKEDMH